MSGAGGDDKVWAREGIPLRSLLFCFSLPFLSLLPSPSLALPLYLSRFGRNWELF